jgi:hypothetical protein
LGQLSGDLRVIKTGLAAGDKVVVNGVARIRAGQKVNPQAADAAAAPGAAPAPAAK